MFLGVDGIQGNLKRESIMTFYVTHDANGTFQYFNTRDDAMDWLWSATGGDCKTVADSTAFNLYDEDLDELSDYLLCMLSNDFDFDEVEFILNYAPDAKDDHTSGYI